VPTSPLGPVVPEKRAPEGCTVTASQHDSVLKLLVDSDALRENVIVQASLFP